MGFGKRALPVSIATSLLVVTCAYSVPTAAVRENVALVGATCAGDRTCTPLISVSQNTPTNQLHNWNLAGIADHLLKPPAGFMTGSIPPVQVTSLPAAPNGVFMVLIGFVCVSLVKDRKVWMTALAALLWAGHIGKQMLIARYPQPLAIRETASSVQAGSRAVQRIAYSVRDMLLLNAKRHTTYGIRYTNYEQRTVNMVAIIAVFSYLIEATNRLAYITRWRFYFSPAFIFENLARGPPESAL